MIIEVLIQKQIETYLFVAGFQTTNTRERFQQCDEKRQLIAKRKEIVQDSRIQTT
jgi:hypothetical protein